MTELTLRDLPQNQRPSFDSVGVGNSKSSKKEGQQRDVTADVFGLDALEDGLRQSMQLPAASTPPPAPPVTSPGS